MKTDIIIIGAGCAGLTAAIYAARAGKKALVLETEGIGGQIATSPKVENYPGIKSVSGLEFSDALFEQATDLGVELELEKALEIKKDADGVTVITDCAVRQAKACVIASGVKPRKLSIKDEDKFEGRGVSYCAVCDGAFYKGRPVAVAGGGNTALQSALMLADICSKVYVIHRRDEFRAEDALVRKARENPGIEFVLDSVVTGLDGGDKLERVAFRRRDGSEGSLEVGALFVLIGKVPDNKAFSGVVDLDESGYIIADESCRTKTPRVYAAGDCRTKEIRQLTTAAADGSVAALAAISDC